MSHLSPSSSPFSSFWIAGFESACHVNAVGERLDMLAATQHDRLVADDYARLRAFGISTVRDTARWHLIESCPGRYDFSSLDPYLAAAREHGVQVIWDLLHYGWPDGLDLFSPQFVERFAAFSGAVVRRVKLYSDAVPLYTPVNEISFFAWAAGDVGWFHPHAQGRGPELKRQLVRAWIAAADAIWHVDPRARIVSAEPLIHTVPPRGLEDVDEAAARQCASQWEAWDMIVGQRDADLGGHPRYLDVVGVNFYHDNQWEVPGGEKIHWHLLPRDPRWVPLSKLLEETYRRYNRPFFVAETSHVGQGRAEWIREFSEEVALAVKAGVPLQGICLYPIVDRFEWDNPRHWHNSGLWDVALEDDGTLRRVLNEPYAEALRAAQARLVALGLGVPEREDRIA